ncbi:hypothetical protein A3K86_15895 [Photobacterium jeanii]|uniref:Endonuclease/exonuclease/phosphatase domain-containing protein n=1 Tax=Photobacterium jeanii TaxID=858640 RepID=A0A178K8X6_9GAMM|nr:endonuclease/exonuclease/phosphatase family protein [Photobacterium jeanii]OAN13142.1 hypothetical protein A3K86_15895 [Photobacterium jeanii]PST89294.1 endonuclease [Photobacterium jeanii]
MKKALISLVIAGALIGCDDTQTEQTTQVKVLTANLWHDLNKGYDAGLAEMKHSQADIIFTQESDGVNARLAEDLNMHMWQGPDGRASIGILSKFPITKVFDGEGEGLDQDRGHQIGALLDINGRDVIVWNNHLDWKEYTTVSPRGIQGNGTTFDGCTPVSDNAELDRLNEQSKRPNQVRNKLHQLKPYLDNNTLVISGGDFNEASGLDWTDASAALFDHKGISHDFLSHRLLRQAGLKDSFRELYPDANRYPGITWPFRNADSWTTGANVVKSCQRAIDDRDRIDFIYYNPADGVKLDKVAFIGPRYSTYFKAPHGSDFTTYEPHEGIQVDASGEPTYAINDFPSDHLWYSATFNIKTPNKTSKKPSLNFNPKFENTLLGTDGTNLTVGFNISNWQHHEAERDYWLFITSHAASPSSYSGGRVAIKQKPDTKHPLAVTVDETFLRSLKANEQKLQLRLFTMSGPSPKILASKTFTLDEIEKIVDVKVPTVSINNGQSLNINAAIPFSWENATQNPNQWIGIYTKGQSVSEQSKGWLYTRTDLTETSSLADWHSKPSKGNEQGSVTLPSLKTLLQARMPNAKAGEYDFYLFGDSDGKSSVLAKQTVTVTD